MNVQTAIRRAAPVLAQYGNTDDGILVVWLIRAGLSRADAHKSVRFVPLAFARVILGDVPLPDTYIRLLPDGSQQEHALRDEEFFTAATALAPQITSELGNDAFTAIVCLSSEFDAVNQALNAGSAPHDLIMSPPVIEWSDALNEPPQRPWWKFWG